MQYFCIAVKESETEILHTRSVNLGCISNKKGTDSKGQQEYKKLLINHV